MQENLDKNNEGNKEISDNTTKQNSEVIKEPKSEKVFNMDLNNGNSESNSASKVGLKNENTTLDIKKLENLFKKNKMYPTFSIDYLC